MGARLEDAGLDVEWMTTARVGSASRCWRVGGVGSTGGLECIKTCAQLAASELKEGEGRDELDADPEGVGGPRGLPLANTFRPASFMPGFFAVFSV